ncbi:hypothetical protein K7459_30205, partial [Pseudomonas fluorescens]|nr:hypothetical protein [Pseudomonas fluorescens]
MIRKGRSEKTISGYRDHVERLFSEWLKTPLLDLTNDPARVAKKHDQLTKENSPYIANGSMRTLRAIYNHARKILRLIRVIRFGRQMQPSQAQKWLFPAESASGHL